MQATTHVKKLSRFFRRFAERITHFWCSLTLAQRLYLIAFIASLSAAAMLHDASVENMYGSMKKSDDSDSIGIFGVLYILCVLTALVIELWPKLIKFWEHTIGKAIIFIFYAFLANYALAYAAGTINQITGVSADHFPYTHNLSLMLSIPTWFMISTFIVLILTPLLQPVYMVFLLLLKPFGLQYRWHKPDYRFPIITSFIRMSLCTIIALAFFLITVLSGVSGSMKTIFSTVIGNFSSINLAYGTSKDADETSNEDALTISTTATKSKNNITEVNTQKNTDHEYYERVNNYDNRIKQILAYFIYELEADSYSRCQVTPGRRVVELNDYDILEIWPIEGKEKAYHFEVKPCISPGIKLHLSSQAKALY
ncbi:hypothetical protein [Pseudoalteromonas sp. MTN2-4]|uniref:hypothetical protein n=1 Tax=Pseudoalteromonas sp. MTN2-4 TaxID=3056555 RepID=UPI0036F2366F